MLTSFPFRWVSIILGGALILKWTIEGPIQRRLSGARDNKNWNAHFESYYLGWILALCGGFFLLALGAKYSQLEALQLNGQDFWLFVDMVEQMRQGGFMLTRFAPQAIGWVQHAVVHPYITFAAILVPLSWIIGSLGACLFFGPAVIAAAAAFLAEITRPRWGHAGALGFAAAFLASSLVGRIVMYDVHPEAAYPFFAFAWAWSAGWGDAKIRPIWLLLSTLGLMGVKPDSFLLFFPLLFVTAWKGRSQASTLEPSGNSKGEFRHRWLLASGILAVAMVALQFIAIRNYGNGNWGPAVWQGLPVTIPGGAGALEGKTWSGPSAALDIAESILAKRGGISGVITSFFSYLISRPVLSLLIVAPWIILRSPFWIAALPWLGVLSLLDEPGKLINYYSAPLLGILWLAASTSGPMRPLRAERQKLALRWVLAVSLILGGSGLTFYRLRPEGQALKAEAIAKVRCLPSQGWGVVSSRFLHLVPRDRIWSDRVGQDPPHGVSFFLFSEELPSYEFPNSVTKELRSRLANSAQWEELGSDCRKIAPKTTHSNERIPLTLRPSDTGVTHPSRAHLFVMKSKK